MQISFSDTLEGERAQYSIGRLKATSAWRAGNGPVAGIEREVAVRALVREAEEYGADALVEVSFAIEQVRGPDVDGVPLRRVTAMGTAVRFAMAA
jgi:hydrogenase maturation factor